MRPMIDVQFDSLTPAESRVLASLMEGHSVPEVASEQYIAVSTVRSHVQSILRKLGVHSVLAAVVKAYQYGWTMERAVA